MSMPSASMPKAKQAKKAEHAFFFTFLSTDMYLLYNSVFVFPPPDLYLQEGKKKGVKMFPTQPFSCTLNVVVGGVTGGAIFGHVFRLMAARLGCGSVSFNRRLNKDDRIC